MAKQLSKGERVSGAGKKGGTRFPNYSLKDLLPNLKDLTSKTHSKPISIEQLSAGVFKIKAKSVTGQIKYSSLKQFQLAEGEYKAISATKLATDIVLASDDEKVSFLRTAFLNVIPFKNAFETFQDSSIAKSKIKSYSVSSLKVHLDLSDKFVESFLASAEEAGLCTLKGDEVTFASSKGVEKNNSISDIANADVGNDEFDEDEAVDDEILDNENIDEDAEEQPIKNNKKATSAKPNISISLDASLDPDKLAKQLKLLKQYGLI